MAINRFFKPVDYEYTPIPFQELVTLGKYYADERKQAEKDLAANIKTFGKFVSPSAVDMENYNEKVEKQLLEVIKQKEDADRRLLVLEWVVGILSVIVLIVPIIIAAYVQMEDWLRVLLVFSGFIPCIVGFCWAIKIEQVAGYYKCAHCGHKYVPMMKSVLWSMHMGRTRYMRCPECGEKSWQKKVISKD